MDGEPTHFRKTSKNIVGQCCSNMFKSMIVQPLLGMIHPYSSQESGDQTSSNISESTNQPYETGPNSIKHLAFRPPSLVVVFEHLRPPLTPNSSSCIHSFEIHSIHELWPNLGVEHPPELASWPKTCFFFSGVEHPNYCGRPKTLVYNASKPGVAELVSGKTNMNPFWKPWCSAQKNWVSCRCSLKAY